MALAANALVTLSEAQEYLGSGSDADPKVEAAINRASGLIEAYCDRPLKRTPAIGPVAFRLSAIRGCVLRVDADPIDVDQVVAVTVDGTVQTVWRKEADGDPNDFEIVVGYVSDGVFHPGKSERVLFRPDTLYRSKEWLTTKVGGILLSYFGGLPAIPEDLKEVALLMVRKVFDNQQKSLSEVITVNTPSGGVTLFDRWMPSETRELLDSRYRRWRV